MTVFELTRALVDIESITNNEERAGNFLYDYLAALALRFGGRVERMEVEPRRFNVFAQWGDRLDVTLSTHIDTVPPFFVSREDHEFIWGRGACDTKGIVACMIHAVQGLLEAGDRNFGLLFVVGEERNSAGAYAAAKNPRGSRFLINGEPTENKLAIGSKGVLRYEVSASGKMAHSAYPELGDSAIHKLIAVLADMQRIALPVDELLGPSTLNIGTLAGNGNYIDETRFAKGDWNTAIGSLITNDLHGGVYIDRFSDTLDRALLPSTGALAINIAGTPVGGNPAAPSTLTETRYDLNDSFSFVAGPHALKLGAEMARNRDGMTQLYNGAGSYTYPSLTAFAEDFTPVGQPRNYTEFNQTVGEPVTDIRSTEIAAYAQDEWKAGRRLRFTLGARWEKVKFPKPPSTSTAYYQVDTIASPSTDFAPRAGGTYLLDDRTVIRGGLGFYYEPFTGQLMREMYAETDFNQNTLTGTPGQSGSLVFPKVVAGFTSVPGGLQDIIYGTNKFRNPYEEVGTLSIERRLNARTSIALSYVDDRGQRLWTAVDQNLSTPNVIAPNYGYETYTIDNAAGTATGTYTTVVYTLQTIATNTTGKSDLNSAHVWEVWNSGGSKYHAVALQLREQMLYGLSLQGSYTWSHAIDDVNSAPVIGGVVPASYTPGDFRDDQGNSNFDQRNHAVINLTWQPPFLKSNSIPARFLINGWQISAVATLTSSLPETPVVLVNGQQFSGIDMLYVNSLNGSGGSNRVPFESVNSLAAGGETNVDARVTRMLPFTERIKGMLMVEAFNAFNHQYTTSVNNIAYTATSGVLKPVAGVGAPTAAYGAPFGTNARFCQVAFRITF